MRKYSRGKSTYPGTHRQWLKKVLQYLFLPLEAAKAFPSHEAIISNLPCFPPHSVFEITAETEMSAIQTSQPSLFPVL